MQSGLLRAKGLNDSPRQRFQKGDRTRRMWTLREEEILAATLLELVARGWKSDNGFRAGYLSKIEDSIRSEFPNSDLKATPHITSKISSWKKSYASLRAILGRSSVGFNTDGDHKIDCDDDQCDQIVQADKDAKFMRTKSWPFWETWKCIFGKDRASGGGVENIDDAADRARSQLAGASQCNENDYHPSFDDFPVDESTPLADTPDFNDNSSGNSTKQIKLCDILGDKPQRLEVFMGMPATARLGYVLRLIAHNRKDG
ncbi:hypothetical protein AAHA92_14416 [Salvia divinorum]|uniref:Myb/SANT-like domain-containing protein n=1 Tax=Salvia divinorum TaxID=28513 RepID=A0ABD1HBH1_SALDI